MENIRIRCKVCGNELEANSIKTVSCGCPNMAIIRGDKISANDLSKIIMLNNIRENKKSTSFSQEDIAWQEARRQRKVKKLNFEVK